MHSRDDDTIENKPLERELKRIPLFNEFFFSGNSKIYSFVASVQ